jgi:predicted nuclease of predicted toxin-antitoxin system
MDVHVPQAITDQLRRRGIDVLTAIEDGADELPDDELLERVRLLERVLFTQDIRFKAMAQSWQH